MSRKQDLISIGERALLGGSFERAMWTFDSALYLTPGHKDPQLWQRGLACFYSGRCEEGKKQFEADMTENGSDIEEVIWHFLCRCKMSGFRKSQAEGFLPLCTPNSDPTPSPPPPAPMPQVLQLYQGTATVEDVFKAARNPDGSPAKSYNDTNAVAYANFYVGLYYEMQGDLLKAAEYLKAAADLKNPDYIGKLMATHSKLVNKMTSPMQLSPPLRLSTSSDSRDRRSDISRIIQGGWQLSHGHLTGSQQATKSDIMVKLLKAYDAGIRAFDCGDIYTGVEELYGGLIKALHYRGIRDADIRIFTKLVPDLDVIHAGNVDRAYVRSVVRRSLNRLGLHNLSLVQLHWWDYHFPGYLAALGALHELVKEGIIENIGLTNFDAEHTREIIEAGIPIVSTQVYVVTKWLL
jgi:tetratricopeptide (TPR) repeat protein